MAISDQRRFYDQRWSNWEFAGAYKLQRCAEILGEFARLNLRQPAILDLGCGTGWFSGVMGNFGPTVGVDLSPAAIKQAKSRYPHVQFHCEDVASWNPPGRSFDVVVSQEVIEHMEDQNGYLRLARSVLRDGGFLILTTPNAPVMALAGDDDLQPVENWLDVRELTGMLKKAGFALVRRRTIIPYFGRHWTRNPLASSGVKRLLKKLGMLPALTAVHLRLNLGLHQLVVARANDSTEG